MESELTATPNNYPIIFWYLVSFCINKNSLFWKFKFISFFSFRFKCFMSVFFFFYLIWISWLYIIILCDNFVKNSLFKTKFECHTISTHIYSQSDMRTIQIAIVIQQSFSLKNKSDQCHIMLHNVLSYCACGQEEMTWKCIENERIKMFSKFGCLSLLLGVPNASVLIQTADCTDRPQLQGFPLIIVFLTIFCRVCFVFVLICGGFLIHQQILVLDLIFLRSLLNQRTENTESRSLLILLYRG